MNLKLLIDTGASHGLILNRETDPEIRLPEKTIETSLGRGLGGRLTGKMGKLQSLAIGRACWEDVISTFPDEGYLLDSLIGNTVFRNGSLGGDILSRFKIVFNFPLEEIYIKPGRQFKKDFTYNLSGITVRAIGSSLNIYEIVEVREGSAADRAGIRENDRLLRINNAETSELTLGRVISLLNAKAGKKLKLRIERADEELDCTFRLEDNL
ncbi:MAG: PDZ domain-containing protein [Cyclobacteriaceae bacterium]